MDELLHRELLETLSDPNNVHMNMLRGAIAKPSIEQIVHLYGRQALLSAILEDHVIVPKVSRPKIELAGMQEVEFCQNTSEFERRDMMRKAYAAMTQAGAIK